MALRNRPSHLGLLGPLVAAAFLVGACSPVPSPSAPSAPPSSAPAGSPSPGASGTASASPAGPTSVPTVPTGAYSCAYPINLAGAAAGVQLTAVRVAAHPETAPPSDRIVFEFAGTSVPSIEIQSAAPPFVHDPSGLPLDVPGSSFLRVVLRGATGAGSYTGPVTFDLGSPRLTSLREAGDFEAVQTWIAGSPVSVCARLQVLSGPARLVVDLAAS